ncbi:hypothetical protein B0H11DRAFT_2253254 [Mycena galericulata]|nr:hypothetical protein B0H11DRAFT_2253254 [Mycena galericulata]
MSTAAASASTGSGCSLVVSAGNSSQDLRLDLELPAPSIDWTSCCSHKRTSEQEEFEKTASLCARFRVQGEAGFGHCVLGIESGSVCRSRSAWIASKVAPVSSLDVPAADQDFGSRCHLALSTKCRLDEVTAPASPLSRLKPRCCFHDMPTRRAAPASPLDVHDATQDFVAHRRRSHLPLSTICRLDAVTAPVSLLDVHDTIQDLGAPPRRSHVAVSTKCRLDQQSLYHFSTSTTRFKTWEPLAVEATLLFPRYADLTSSAFITSGRLRPDLRHRRPSPSKPRCSFHDMPTRRAAPASPLDVHDATQDFVAPPRRSHVAVSTKCRLDQQSLYHFSTSTTRFKTWEPLAVEATLLFPRYADLTSSAFITSGRLRPDLRHRRPSPSKPRCSFHDMPTRRAAPASPLDVHDATQDFVAPPRRSHVAVSTKCRLDQQSLYHFSTSTTRFKTWEPLAVEATLLFPRYADLTSSAFITSGRLRPDLRHRRPSPSKPRCSFHDMPTRRAAPASPLDVHDATQDFVAHRRRSHLPLSTICRLDAVTAPVSLLDVHDTIQDLGAPPHRSHVAVSTICRVDQQRLHHLWTSATRLETSEAIVVEATLLFPRHADLTRSTLSSNIPTAAPASPLDVHDATQDFVAHRRRSHLPLSTICRLDAQPLYHVSTSTTRFKTWEPLPVEATLLFPRYADLTRLRLHHLSTSVTRLKTSQPIAVEATSLSPRYADLTRSQSLYHFSTSTTRFKTWEPLAVEATLLFPRYADLTSSAFITSGRLRPDLRHRRPSPSKPRCSFHDMPTRRAAPASPLDVHDATQDFVAPPRRSHVAVSTKCRLDQQSLYHFSTSTTRFKTWEPLAVEATLLFPRYADLTSSAFITSGRLRPDLRHRRPSPSKPRCSFHDMPTRRAAPASPLDVHDATQDFVAHRRRSHLPLSTICRLDAQPLYHFSTSTTRFKTWEPLAVEATLLFPRYADLTGLQPLHHLWTSATRLETSEATAVEAIWFFPRYADLTRSQPFRLLPTLATRLKTSEPIAVEATSLFARYADLTRLNSGIVFHHRPPRRLHVRRSLLAAPVPVFVAFSRKYVGSDRAAMGEMRAARALFDAGVVCALCGGGRSAGYPFGRVQEDRGREFLLGIVATVTTFLDSSKRYPTWESTLPFFPAVRVLRAAVRGLVRRRRQRYPAWESTLPFFSAVRVLRAAVRGLVRRRRHRLDNGIRLGKAPYHPSPPLEVLVAVAATVSTAVSDLGKHPAIPPRRPRAARRRGRSWSSLSPPGHHPGLGTVILVAPSPSSPLSGGVGFSSPC